MKKRFRFPTDLSGFVEVNRKRVKRLPVLGTLDSFIIPRKRDIQIQNEDEEEKKSESEEDN